MAKGLDGNHGRRESPVHSLFLSAGDPGARGIFHPDSAIIAKHVDIVRVDQVGMMGSDKTEGPQFLIIGLKYFRDEDRRMVREVHVGIITFCFHAGDLPGLHNE